MITRGQHAKVETHKIFLLYILETIFLGKSDIFVLGKIILHSVRLIISFFNLLDLYPVIVIAEGEEDYLIPLIVVARSKFKNVFEKYQLALQYNFLPTCTLGMLYQNDCDPLNLHGELFYNVLCNLSS